MTIVSSPERVDLHAMRVRALVALGRPDEAVRAAAALARARPDRPVLALEAAERALHASDAATARAMIDLARPTLVWKPDALVAAARIEGALGRTDEGRVLATRALALEPAHEDARRWLEDVAGTEPAPLTITASDALARLPALDPEAPWEVVAEELVMRVADDGSATKWLRRVLRAQHPPEARADRTFSWRFDPSQESVRVLGARVVAPDGRVSVARERHIRTAAEDWYNLYFDVRVLEIPFDRLPVGALVEVTLRIDPVGQHFPGVFELVEVLRDRVPKHRHRIVVDAPVSLGLRSAVIAGDGATIVEAREPSAPGRERLVLEASGLAALPHEPLAPGAAETSPVWQLTTFPSWAEVGRWYRSLLASQVVVTPEMRADVQAIVAAEGGVPARVTEALVALVRDHIRYVGLEFGIHGYQPYRTDEVWARRFGDCKDQALLLRTLLSLADIPAEVALVRTRGQGRLAGALPSLALFDHAIVHLPERGLFVDSTVLHHGIGELPAADQGAQVLLVTDDAQLALTPVDAPTRNQVVGAYSVTLDPDGGGGIQGTVAFHGAQAPPYRAALADPATQHDKLQAVLNRRYPGLVLDGARLSDPEVVDRPFELVFHATVPRLASVIGDTLHVLRPAGIDGQAERLASLPTRALPLVPGPPMTFDLTFRYVLPTGYRVRELPRGGAAEGAFGRWAVTWTAEPGVVTVATTLQWAVDQIEAARYPALRAFVRAFDQAVGAALVLERGAP
ncbi:MAG: DUF3857 domain-containing protein [Deltaproteobacteria bacterium]|nr:DUF3857 domain-containing protein [Deltaproteobacteria bacterium]